MNKLKQILETCKIYNVEKFFKDYLTDAVAYRRSVFEKTSIIDFEKIPYINHNPERFYNDIYKKNCENVVGYVPLPVGLVGPLKIMNREHFVPIGTTEGALVASLNRGCKVIDYGSDKGVNVVVEDLGMTRAPLLRCKTMDECYNVKNYIKNNFDQLKKIFESTTSYGILRKIDCEVVGSHIYIKFYATTGDAMGMNIITKGCKEVLDYLQDIFVDLEIESLSSNLCTDKKAAAVNWINGRGKKVNCEVDLDIDIVESILDTNVEKIIDLNKNKNLIGSSLAGTIGGNNSHASNIMAGIFVATGQDLGQIGTSSMCLTDYNIVNNKLRINTMLPCLEVGTVGGGTDITTQRSYLKLMGINNTLPAGKNSELLAEIIGSTVLAGELSLMGGLSNNQLVNAHLKLNRKN